MRQPEHLPELDPDIQLAWEESTKKYTGSEHVDMSYACLVNHLLKQRANDERMMEAENDRK